MKFPIEKRQEIANRRHYNSDGTIKMQFNNALAAKHTAEEFNKKHNTNKMVSYYCPICNMYHLGERMSDSRKKFLQGK